jgi:D-alanyl-D-alanine-carboxypeptidase/D-alanyl-D-alanine-endopeptidase
MKARLLMLLLSIASTAAAQDAPLLDPRVRELVAQRVGSGAYPSVVIGMIRGDRRQIEGFGRVGEAKPDANTVYEIGSTTKTFTALLLAEAVTRGEVTLDTPVQKLLPGFTIPESVTLGELATQSSGLPRLPSNLLPKNAADPYADYTAEDLKRFFATYEPARKAGEQYEYSNLGFGLLGHALARKAGTTYEALVRKRITGPLKMNDTTIALSEAQAKRFAPAHDAAGNTSSPWALGTLEGAGALRSTANDLLTYLAAHMKPKSKAYSLVIEPRRARDAADRRIALGWNVDSGVVWHNGMTGGYAAFIGFTADGDRGIVVLTNISRDVTQIGFSALRPESLAAAPAAKEVTLAPEVLAEYVGTYPLAPQFALAVTVQNGQLFIQGTGQQALPVFASAKDEFFSKLVNAQFSFKRDANGRVDAVVLHQGGRDMNAPRASDTAPPPPERKEKEIRLEPAALQKYVGRYELAPSFVLDVTAEDAQLFVQATAQPRFPVFATAPDEFFYKVVDARLSFVRGADGSIEAVVLHQNGQDVRGRRVPRP